MRYLMLTCVLSLAVSALPGCGKSVPEGEFTFAAPATHHTLDPQKMSWMHDFRIVDQMFEMLVWVDFTHGMKIQPAAAESWDVSEDGLTYTFHIRPEAKWSNGDPLTAEDYIYAWRRAMMPDHAAQYAYMFYVIDGAEDFFHWRQDKLQQYAKIKQSTPSGDSAAKTSGATSGGATSGGGGGVDASMDAAKGMWKVTRDHFRDTVGLSAPDDKTLVVRLKEPTPYFLQLVAFGVFAPNHRASIEAATDLAPATGMRRTDEGYWSDPERVVSNGPYLLDDRQFKRFVSLKANPHYWDRDSMKNDSIVEQIIPNIQVALQNYEQGDIDWLPDVPTGEPIAAQLVNQGRPDVHTQPMAGMYFYDFNCQPKLASGKDNPLADPRVRRAMAMAIDRHQIVDRVTRLHQPIAKTYVPVDSFPGYDPPVDAGITFDPDRAKALLAEAGYPGGKGLTGLSILYNTEGGHEGVAQAVAAMWRKNLGLSVPLEGQESTTLGQRQRDHEFTIARASWFGDYPDPLTFLDKMTTDAGNNDCGWSNEKYDALLKQAGDERDPDKRLGLLRQAETVLLKDQPMAMLFQYKFVMLWDPARVKGLTPSPWAHWRLEEVQVADQK